MRRSAVPLVLAAVLTTGLVGCVPFVPTRPNAAPMQIGVHDGEVQFRWCGEATAEMGFLDITFRLIEERGEFVSAFSGSGSFLLGTGEQFTVASPPPGLEGTGTQSIPISDEMMFVFVTSGQSASNRNGIDATFHVASLAALDEGEWLTTAGELVQGDCAA